MKTFNDYSPVSIVIASALDSQDLYKIDDFLTVKSIIAIPWLRERTAEWIGTWGPLDIRNQVIAPAFEAPSCVVQRAMRSLASTINMSTGITHSSDNEKAKTFILALHKYEEKLDANQVAGFLIRELGWATDAAQEIAKLIATLNEGKFFKGGERTGLQHHYKRWQEECQRGVPDDE